MYVQYAVRDHTHIYASPPQMRGMLESNPDVAHALSDPAMFRQSLETARNPELMREQVHLLAI